MTPGCLKAIKEFKEEWTPEALQVLRHNVSAKRLAQIIYEAQSDYVGAHHKEYCLEIMSHFFKEMIIGLASDIEPTVRDPAGTEEK